MEEQEDLVKLALTALVERESARRSAAQGGTMANMPDPQKMIEEAQRLLDKQAHNQVEMDELIRLAQTCITPIEPIKFRLTPSRPRAKLGACTL